MKDWPNIYNLMMRYTNNKKKKNNDNFTLDVQLVQGSYGREKSWNLKMHFSGLEKSWVLGKMAEVMEKSWIFISLVQRFRAV